MSYTYADNSTKLCSACDPACTICTSSLLTTCTACRNVTTTAAGITTTTIYYKDLLSTTCSPSCPTGQYINTSVHNNVCSMCSTTCTSCTMAACQTCVSSYFLYNSSCITNCPNGYFNDPTVIVVTTVLNTTQCTTCSPECKTCVGSAAACTSCQTVIGTTPGTDVVYYWDPTLSQCALSCSTGLFSNPTANAC